MKKSLVLLLAMMTIFGFAGLAGAHVVVSPSSVPQNSYQVFTVRVPSEIEGTATASVKVAIPEGVNVSRFEPKPEWTYTTESDADGKITSVTWTSAGAGLGDTEFGEFRMQGKVAEDATELVWKAYQTYANNEVVEWTGAADAEKPASVTAVTAATGDGHGDSHGSAPSGGSSDHADEAEAGGERDPLTLGLAIAGLAAGLLALVLVLVRKRA